jgi:hypothetical protein
MSMLSRYQKSGGFVQLLQLIETCGKTKQDSFLNMIEGEDPRWARAIREKMLTIEKILTWDDNSISEIAARLQELTLATAMHGFTPEQTAKCLKTFTHAQKRNIEDLNKAKVSSPAEVSAAFFKILQETRSMILHGYLRPEKFAPELIIPDNYEDELGKPGSHKAPDISHDSTDSGEVPNLDGFGHPGGVGAHGNVTHGGAATHAGAANDSDVNSLRGKVHVLSTENNQLKTEVKILRDKLAQIKKIA